MTDFYGKKSFECERGSELAWMEFDRDSELALSLLGTRSKLEVC